jgi:hypothetical protein
VQVGRFFRFCVPLALLQSLVVVPPLSSYQDLVEFSAF